MKNKFLEAGVIVNTHGVRGEVKILPWADSPAFLTNFAQFFVDGTPLKITSVRVHKNYLLASFEGICDIESAIKLKNKTIFIDRDETKLEPGKNFLADLIGLRAIDAKDGQQLGVVKDILSLPSNDVYVIQGTREILVPAVGDFVAEINLAESYISFRLIEGM